MGLFAATVCHNTCEHLIWVKSWPMTNCNSAGVLCIACTKAECSTTHEDPSEPMAYAFNSAERLMNKFGFQIPSLAAALCAKASNAGKLRGFTRTAEPFTAPC